MAPFFLEILDFQFLHVFPRYFNNFAIGFFVCKCALVSFYTYFLRILTILQISFIFQTPPRPPRGPPQDLQGPPQDPLGPGQTEWAHTAGSEPLNTNNVCKVEWVHTAFRLINGLQTPHQTQTVIVATQRPGGMRGAVE